MIQASLTQVLVLLVFPALVVYSAVSDLLRMTISNRVTATLALAFAATAALTGMPFFDIGWHLAAGFTVLAAGFACFAFGWIGGGDAKMAAAAALWFGFDQTLSYLLVASVFGGVLTLAMLNWRTWPLPAAIGRHEWVARLHHPKTGIPYGIALAAAALAVYPQSGWLVAAV